MLAGIQRTTEYSPEELKRLAKQLAKDYTPKGRLLSYKLRVTNQGTQLVAEVVVKVSEGSFERTLAL